MPGPSFRKADASEAPASSTAPKPNPFLVSAPIGLSIIDFETGWQAFRLGGMGEIEKAKTRYSALFEDALAMLRKKGLDKPKGKEWAQEDVLRIWKVLAPIIKKNFSIQPNQSVNSLFDAFSGKQKIPLKAPLDCDTSVFFAADIFTRLGLDCAVRSMPGHTILRVNASKPIWVETTAANADYLSKASVDKCYPYSSEEKFSANMAILYNNRGNAKFHLNDSKGAISDYGAAIRLNPGDADTYFCRGNAKFSLEDYKGAIADYGMAIKLRPNNADAYSTRGIAKSRLDDNKGAIADYDTAILRNPGDAASYHNRGVAKYLLGDKKGAIADYDAAIRLNPDYADTHYNRGVAKSDLGDKNGAKEDYLESAKLYEKQGKQESAREARERAAKL